MLVSLFVFSSCFSKYLERVSDSFIATRKEITSRKDGVPAQGKQCNSHSDNIEKVPQGSTWGVLSWFSSSSDSSFEGSSTSPSEHTPTSNDSSFWDYLSWAQNLFSLSSTVKSNSNHTETQKEPDIQSELNPDSKTDSLETERAKNLDEFMRLYREQMDERSAQLPLVGMAMPGGGRRKLPLGPRVMEGVEQILRNKASQIWSKWNGHVTKMSTEEMDNISVSSVSDLACIDCQPFTIQYIPQNEDWFRYYMELEWDENTTPNSYPSINSQEWNLKISLYLEKLTTFLERLKFSDHIQYQFLIEQDVNLDPSLEIMFQEATEAAKHLWTKSFSQIDDFSFNKTQVKRKRSLKFDLNVLGRDDSLDDVLVKGQKFIRSLKCINEMELHVIDSEILKMLSSSSTIRKTGESLCSIPWWNLSILDTLGQIKL